MSLDELEELGSGKGYDVDGMVGLLVFLEMTYEVEETCLMEVDDVGRTAADDARKTRVLTATKTIFRSISSFW